MLETRTYRAESIQAALLLAKADLGPDAVIVDVRHIGPRTLRGEDGVVELIAAPAQAVVRPAETRRPVTIPGSTGDPLFLSMTALGLGPRFTEDLVRTFRRYRGTGEALRRALAGRIAHYIAVAPWLPVGGRAILALVGPTGVGKTTTALKLAATARADGFPAQVISLAGDDGHDMRLEVLARGLGVPVIRAANGTELQRALRSSTAPFTLIDTVGTNPYDPRAIAALEAALTTAPLVVCVTLPVSGDLDETLEAARRYAPLRPRALILTKLDETRRPGMALGIAERLGRPLLALTTGPSIPQDFVSASTSALAELAAWTLERLERRLRVTDRS
ncbi:GTP-binding protein [Thermomicrobium sp. 4228-Ro]|uniref:flagellar biosynthesis protein FlhF n=1 Tax=Thermomicrobium sp. 4228-Ro TaxID=2993937 RepID=UPI0022491541|nr:GTP-binding protein [Thermomicrobium sp. 4228-Ro]MCX2727953.1 GTP-binding protein [Thermomicrobium sp. 4228-Ro]